MTVILILMPVVSRWAMVYAIYVYRYARPSGLGTAFKQATRWPQFTAATIITLAVALALMPWFSLTGLYIIFGIFIITTALAFYLKYKFAGLTGDTYGAINELAEVMTLVLAIPILSYVGPI
jgi:adenosylcobinamide-GDP ribazoletransferase